MGQYTDLSTLKQRIEYDKTDFGNTTSGLTISGFESLLTQCEEESRGIIESIREILHSRRKLKLRPSQLRIVLPFH